MKHKPGYFRDKLKGYLKENKQPLNEQDVNCGDPGASNYDPNDEQWASDGCIYSENTTVHIFQVFQVDNSGNYSENIPNTGPDNYEVYVEGAFFNPGQSPTVSNEEIYQNFGSPPPGTWISQAEQGLSFIENACYHYVGEFNVTDTSVGGWTGTINSPEWGIPQSDPYNWIMQGMMSAFDNNPQNFYWGDSVDVCWNANFQEVLGCTDPTAGNFDPYANTDDGSCVPIIEGCTDPDALNYNPSANTDDGSCEFGTYHQWQYCGMDEFSSGDMIVCPTWDFSSCYDTVDGFDVLSNEGQSIMHQQFYELVGSPELGQAISIPDASWYGGYPQIDSIGNIVLPYFCMQYIGETNVYAGMGGQIGLDNGVSEAVLTDCASKTDCDMIYGCMDETAINYNPEATWSDPNNVFDGACIPGIPGCTQYNALNYNPEANVDDGSCIAIVEGCTNPEAFNYNPEANVDDGSCIAVILGCTDPTAFNYNPEANTDDGSCIPVIEGCTDSQALNYNEEANVDDDSCEYPEEVEGCTDEEAINYIGDKVMGDPTINVTDDGSCYYVEGCTDPEAANYNEEADFDDGSCYYNPGCTDPLAVNYDPEADFDDGSCIPTVLGCTDPEAINYNELANTDDGSCYYNPGCTDPDAFNYDETADFDDGSCVPVIEGCTDPTALNYNEFANTDDGSCIPVIEGCTDPSALNWNPEANTDDGSCIAVVTGCTDENAINYNPEANTDDGSCYYNPGCTDPTAFNYDPEADFDDGSCIPVIPGCTDPEAVNYSSLANTDDGSCYYNPGCTDPEAFNYDPEADFDDGSCVGIINGCTDPEAVNYNPEANTDDGSCYYNPGCTDETAFNYDPEADFDDGSCIPVIPGCTDPTAVNYDETANTDDGSCYGYEDLDCNNFENDLTGGEQAWLCRSCAQGQAPEIIIQLCDCCPILGCTDSEAVNYDETATDDDGSCEYEGCTDGNALNFDDTATIDDGSCDYPDDTSGWGYECTLCGGCMQTEYGPYASEEECQRSGCSNSFYDSYMEYGFQIDSEYTEEERRFIYCQKCSTNSLPIPGLGDACGCCDDEISIYDEENPWVGCTDPNAVNYDETASEDDGSCEYLDCNDFNTLTSPEQGLICCGCDSGCNFVPYLPPAAMGLCECCESEPLLSKPIDPSNVDRLINKLKSKGGETKPSQFDRLKELAGLKKRK